MSTVVWNPQPRQRLVIQCPFQEILYGGAAGGGKSDCLVGDWLAHQEQFGKYSNGILFRNSYPELQEILVRMQDVYGTIGAKWKDKDSTWFFPNGSRLRLSYLDSFEDALKHKGDQWDWRAHDELTQRPTDQEYRYLFSRMRSPHGIPVRTLCTTNPDGPGHLWVKKHWKIDKNPGGMVPIHSYTDLINGRLLEEDEGRKYDGLPTDGLPDGIRRSTRIFIPGRLSDNKYLHDDGHYRAGLLALPEAQRKMLLDGRWDITEGAFFDEWDPRYHVVKAFRPPEDWKRWMAGDWGTTSPYAFVWFCQSPGGEVYIYRELVGYKDGDFNKGTREAPSDVAMRLKGVETDEWITERWLDASCFDNEEHGLSVSEQFRTKGVVFQKAQKKFKSGSIAMFRDYLKVTNGITRFHVMDNCQYLIQTIPLLMVDKNNVEQFDSDGPDHACLACDTQILADSGWKEIRNIVHGENVWTPLGWKPCYPFPTGIKRVYIVRLSNGNSFRATSDHKFLTTRGFLDLTHISIGDTLLYGGATYESNSYLRQDSRISRGTILPMRILLPTEREATASHGLDVLEWGNPQRIPCPSHQRGQDEQPYLKSGIDKFAQSLVPAHDPRTERMGKTEHREGDREGEGLASLGRGAEVACGTCENITPQSPQEEQGGAMEGGGLLPMLEHVQDAEGKSFLQFPLSNERLEQRFYGVRVEAIEPSSFVPVYDTGVEDAHCLLIGAGVFASNCDAVLYGIRRNIKSKEEIAQSRGVVERNRRVMRKFGAYGAH